MRDRIATEAQSGLDALARNLIERFEESALDPTILPGAPGLFTDGGSVLDLTNPANEIGLADRISVNANIDPSRGGAIWRIRDGVGAATAGEVGNSNLLTALADRIAAPLVVASGPSAGLARSLSGLASDLLSSIDRSYRHLEDAQAFHSSRAGALAHQIATDGVDTDDELQTLLLIEQAYAANAKVIQTVDQLIQNLLEL
ncbi:flagellar basal body rod C-terminal domain-containing protein [Tropicimonas sp. IMCC6043]|uniref:flagellar basal body rod C-terminal domain-containing protein n=1 Tax=Tropicimonas sp. IMCC6043 TaxID=2510645 RepID=UPI0013EA846F|nr:flagellar basal body rod C-terminal domain-containing protein [Tropicimonas sp. IMCC6043]